MKVLATAFGTSLRSGHALPPCRAEIGKVEPAEEPLIRRETPALDAAGARADATVLINLHREGILAGRTLRHVREAASYLWREQKILLKIDVVMDRPDEATSTIARTILGDNGRFHSVDFGNLGKSRKFGVDHIDSELIFFLDGDDFVSYNWFGLAIRYLRDPGNAKHICHTNYFVGFGEERFIRIGIDSRDPTFRSSELALDWFFCNNLACRKSVFDAVPLSGYDHSIGIGAEDWHWSAEVLVHGFSHVVIPDTVYFYRTKPPGLSLGMAGEFLPWASQAFWPGLNVGSCNDASSNRTALARSLAEATPNELIDKVRNAARPVCVIEPSISYLLEPNTEQRVFVPTVNQRCLALHEEINKQKQDVVVVADPTDYPGNLPNLLRFCRLLAVDCRFLLLVDDASQPLRQDVDGGAVINFASVDTAWQAEHHGARVLGRLAIDSRPKQFFVLGAPRLVRWLSRFSLQMASFSENMAVINTEPAIDPFSRLPYHDTRRLFPEAEYVFVSPKALAQAKARSWPVEWDARIARAFFESVGIECADSSFSAPVVSDNADIPSDLCASNQPVIRFIDQSAYFPISAWKNRSAESPSRYAIVADCAVEVSSSIEADLARPANQAAMRSDCILLFRQFGIRRPDRSILIQRNEQGDGVSTTGKLLVQRALIVPVALLDRVVDAFLSQGNIAGEDEFWGRLIVEITKSNLALHVLVGNALALLPAADKPYSFVNRTTLVKLGRC